MFSLNGTYVIFILLFLVFIQLLNKIMIQPVGAVLEKRGARLKENTDATKSCMQETEKILSDYQSKLHTSRQNAQTIIHNSLSEAQKSKDEKLKGIQNEGRQKLDALKEELSAGRKDLINSLVHPELDLVKNILNKLLGEIPTLVINEQRVAEVLESTR
jgi:F0F1-type ATP synthase membrane subunit b/b'